MRIHLLRHGRARPVNGDFYGAALPPESIDAAARLARSGAIPRPQLLVSSPFRRAQETAAPFAAHFGVAIEVDDAFAEWKLRTLNLGNMEHEAEEERGFADPTQPVAGGESLDQMSRRVMGAVDRVTARSVDAALIVCHGTVIHLICASIAGRQATVEQLRSTPFLDYAVIEAADGRLAILRDVVREADEVS
jgi:broad specificity phosphatase PhoE